MHKYPTEFIAGNVRRKELLGSSRNRWVDIIKMDLGEKG
jgi:hypothetical protein